MKITNVELLVLKSPGLYQSPGDAEEPPGPTYMGLVKVSTDAGICGYSGYSDVETSAPVVKSAVEAPPWSDAGMSCFDGLASLITGENPLEVERLWYKMYRGSIYYGRRGVAIQAISAIDIALWDIAGKYYRQPANSTRRRGPPEPRPRPRAADDDRWLPAGPGRPGPRRGRQRGDDRDYRIA